MAKTAQNNKKVQPKSPRRKPGVAVARKAESVAAISADVLEEKVSWLRDVFPEVVTEGKIDFEALRGVFGSDVDTRPELYSFTWAGKREAIQLLQMPSRAALTPQPK